MTLKLFHALYILHTKRNNFNQNNKKKYINIAQKFMQHILPTSLLQDTRPIDFSFNPYYETDFKWYDRELLSAVRADETHAHNFFRVLALCHTVMPEYKDGKLEYQAQSPDEAALVSAARNFGFVFKVIFYFFFSMIENGKSLSTKC